MGPWQKPHRWLPMRIRGRRRQTRPTAASARARRATAEGATPIPTRTAGPARHVEAQCERGPANDTPGRVGQCAVSGMPCMNNHYRCWPEARGTLLVRSVP